MASQKESNKRETPCPACGRILKLRDEHAGSKLLCPGCGKPIVVPSPGDARSDDQRRPTDFLPDITGLEVPLVFEVPPLAVQDQAVIKLEDQPPLSGVAESQIRSHYEPAALGKPARLDAPSARGPATQAAVSAQIDSQAEYDLDHGYDVQRGYGPITPPPLPPTFPSPGDHRVHVSEPPEEIDENHRLLRVQADPLPPPPKWFLWEGVFSFPWYTTTVGHWVVMTLGFLCLVAPMAIFQGQFAFFVIGIVLTVGAALPTLPYACGTFLAVIHETANGYDAIEDWPESDWRDGLWSLALPGYVVVLCVLAGNAVALLAGADPVLPTAVLTFVGFPILLLSSLEANSIVAPISPPILMSLKNLWQTWLGFYAIAAALLAVATGLLGTIGRFSPVLAVLLGGPVLASELLIYARLVGRVGLRASLSFKEKRAVKVALEPDWIAAGED